MNLDEVATQWRPAPIEDEAVPDRSTGLAVAGLWDGPAPDETVPPLWHWFHFLEWTPHSRLGTDGHPADGPLLPPIEDRRRMFAGGMCTIHQPLRYGEPVRRRRSIHSVRTKEGRTGQLLFVTTRCELTQRGATCVVEHQDVVYRSGPATVDYRDVALATAEPDVGEAPCLRLHTDPPLLFRMSALTANHHRIHYDLPYAVDVEHYPSLVVQGPLLVLHMLEIPRRRGVAERQLTMTYRLHSPVYVGEPLAAVVEKSSGDAETLRIATARHQRHASLKLRYV